MAFKIGGVSLSRLMAAALIGHSAGPRPIRIGERETLLALRARGLIYFDRSVRPKQSIATDKGRDVIAGLLATQVDNLVGAGAEWP
jgi:hypothetical protein